jgi:hypothetical protein
MRPTHRHIKKASSKLEAKNIAEATTLLREEKQGRLTPNMTIQQRNKYIKNNVLYTSIVL